MHCPALTLGFVQRIAPSVYASGKTMMRGVRADSVSCNWPLVVAGADRSVAPRETTNAHRFVSAGFRAADTGGPWKSERAGNAHGGGGRTGQR